MDVLITFLDIIAGLAFLFYGGLVLMGISLMLLWIFRTSKPLPPKAKLDAFSEDFIKSLGRFTIAAVWILARSLTLGG